MKKLSILFGCVLSISAFAGGMTGGGGGDSKICYKFSGGSRISDDSRNWSELVCARSFSIVTACNMIVRNAECEGAYASDLRVALSELGEDSAY